MSSLNRDFAVIAHRGASGYVPEHTLVAKGMAHAMGADFLEQDVVATRDHHAVVLHDIHLDTVTDVAKRFPDRKRSDGRYYVIDFDLAELRTLEVLERFDFRSGKPVFPTRCNSGPCGLRIPSLEEEIRFIQSLNRTTGRDAGIYPEIKQPAWHRENGCDLSRIVIGVLNRFGYRDKQSGCFLQCFDEFEVRRIRNELGYGGRLVQLIGHGHDEASGTDYQRLRSMEGLTETARVADGIGPAMDLVLKWSTNGEVETRAFIADARRVGLDIHPWTLRADALPANCESVGDAVTALVEAGVQGIFTDHPDQVVRAIPAPV